MKRIFSFLPPRKLVPRDALRSRRGAPRSGDGQTMKLDEWIGYHRILPSPYASDDPSTCLAGREGRHRLQGMESRNGWAETLSSSHWLSPPPLMRTAAGIFSSKTRWRGSVQQSGFQRPLRACCNVPAILQSRRRCWESIPAEPKIPGKMDGRPPFRPALPGDERHSTLGVFGQCPQGFDVLPPPPFNVLCYGIWPAAGCPRAPQLISLWAPFCVVLFFFF